MLEIQSTPNMAQVSLRFSKRARSIGNFSGLWDLIHKDFGEVERLVFSSKGGYIGHIWAPLKKRYLKQKRKKSTGFGILVRTGKAKRFLEAGGQAIKQSNSLEIRAPIGIMPMRQNRAQSFKRPVFDYNETVAARWRRITGTWLGDRMELRNGV